MVSKLNTMDGSSKPSLVRGSDDVSQGNREPVEQKAIQAARVLRRQSSQECVSPSEVLESPEREARLLGKDTRRMSSSETYLPPFEERGVAPIERDRRPKKRLMKMPVDRSASPSMPTKMRRPPTRGPVGLRGSKSSSSLVGLETNLAARRLINKKEGRVKSNFDSNRQGILQREREVARKVRGILESANSSIQGYASLKRKLFALRKQFSREEWEKIDLNIPRFGPLKFSLYYFSECLGSSSSEEFSLATPSKEFLSAILSSLERPLEEPVRVAEFQPYAAICKQVPEQQRHDLALAFMANMSPSSLIELVRILCSSSDKRETEFCALFLKEWVKVLLSNGRFTDVLQMAYEKECSDKKKGVANLLSQSYLSFRKCGSAAEHGESLLNHIMGSVKVFDTADMQKRNSGSVGDLSILERNRESFKKVLGGYFSALRGKDLLLSMQVVLTAQRKAVENCFPESSDFQRGKELALGLFLTLVEKQFGLFVSRVLGRREVNLVGKDFVSSETLFLEDSSKFMCNLFREEIRALARCLEASDWTQFQREHSETCEVWEEFKERLIQFIERNTKVPFETWSPAPPRMDGFV